MFRRLRPALVDGPVTCVWPLLFLMLALPTCLMLALLVPPGETPDEGAHIVRAGSLLHGQLLGSRRPAVDLAGGPVVISGVVANAGPLAVTFGLSGMPQKWMTPEVRARLHAIAWADKPSFIPTPNTAPYFPVFYVPAAIGLGVGHLLHLSPYISVLGARLADALAYVALGTLALFVARRGHGLLFATLMLPMSLWLGATCNQDGMMLASLCLAVALISRAVRPAGWSYWVGGALLACVLAVKPPYLPCAAIMLLPWAVSDRRQLHPALGGLALAVLPALIWTPIAQALASGAFLVAPPYHPGPLWPGDPSRMFPAPDARAQLDVFMHAPLRAITLPLETLADEGRWKLFEMVGVLGTLSLVLSDTLYHALFWGLAGAALAALVAGPRSGRGPAPGLSLLVVAAVAGSVILLYDLQYLSWTSVGKERIEGVQGRYFLPFLPILAIALPGIRLPFAGSVRAVMVAPTVGIACYLMVFLPLYVVQTYYLH